MMPLLPGSPAIDVGEFATCTSIDQRGIGRPQGATGDMGAFESRGFTLAITSGNNQTTVVNTAFALPLAISISSSSGEPVDGGEIRFSAPSSGASAVLSTGAVTIAPGAASVTATATGTTGAYAMTATSAGSWVPPSFHLINGFPLSTLFICLPLIIKYISCIRSDRLY